MAGKKHAPLELYKYLEIHEAAMGALVREGCVLPDGDGLSMDPTDRGLLMSGLVQCAGGITVRVAKMLAYVGDRVREGERVCVQTSSYTYHVMLEGFGNVFRYCGPHDDDAHPDHKPYHHKHVYDVLGGDVEGTVEEMDAQGWPTLAEAISEACRWYYDHAEEVERQRASRG